MSRSGTEDTRTLFGSWRASVSAFGCVIDAQTVSHCTGTRSVRVRSWACNVVCARTHSNGRHTLSHGACMISTARTQRQPVCVIGTHSNVCTWVLLHVYTEDEESRNGRHGVARAKRAVCETFFVCLVCHSTCTNVRAQTACNSASVRVFARTPTACVCLDHGHGFRCVQSAKCY